jgi:hypothetical protein
MVPMYGPFAQYFMLREAIVLTPLMTRCETDLMAAEIVIVVLVTDMITLVGLIWIFGRRPEKGRRDPSQ